MKLIYEYLDPDVARWLRENAPNPMRGQNYHINGCPANIGWNSKHLLGWKSCMAEKPDSIELKLVGPKP